MPSPAELNKVIARAKDLAPVTYIVRVPGDEALRLNYMAICEKKTVEQIVLDAIENHVELRGLR